MKISRRTALKVSTTAGLALGIPVITDTSALAKPTRVRVPKIPAQCSAAELAQRNKMLAEQRKLYRWTKNLPNVVGIPMAAAVPPADEPTTDWLIEAADVILNLLQNLAFSVGNLVVPSAKKEIHAISQQLATLQKQLFGLIDDYNNVLKKTLSAPGDFILNEVEKNVVNLLVRTIQGILNEFQSIRKRLFAAAEESFKKDHLWLGDFGAKENINRYNQIWATIPLPESSKHVFDDEWFANLPLAGPNPMIIKNVKQALPKNFEVSDSIVSSLLSGDDTLSAALSNGRVYICDYAELGPLVSDDATYKILTGPGYTTAPIALYIREKSSRSLTAVAIQVGQDPKTHATFYPPESKTADRSRYWGWQMAKTVVKTADFNHHEWFTHLGRTHLVSEAFVVAMHRQLSVRHPLHVLLAPHYEGDLYVNDLAATIILGKTTFGDLVLGPDIADSAATAAKARSSWNFMDSRPTVEFASRGMDDAKLDFHYRDDALRVWKEIHSWVSDYLKVYYPSDAAVVKDTELQAWISEVTVKGELQGVPQPTSIATLIEIVTMAIFTASAQHAAVNYPQATDMVYTPAAAGMVASLPVKNDTYTEADWIAMMPSTLCSLAQFYFLNVLGSIYYRRLGEYHTNAFPFPSALTDPRVAVPLKRFQRRLKNLDQEISEINKSRRWPYEMLMPKNIPMSTNV